MRWRGWARASIALAFVCGACEVVAPISVVAGDGGPDAAREAGAPPSGDAGGEAEAGPGGCDVVFCQSAGWATTILDGGAISANAADSSAPLRATITDEGAACEGAGPVAVALAKTGALGRKVAAGCESFALTFDLETGGLSGACEAPTPSPEVVILSVEPVAGNAWTLAVAFSDVGAHLAVGPARSESVGPGGGVHHVVVQGTVERDGGSASLSVDDAGTHTLPLGDVPAGILYVSAGVAARPSAGWSATISHLTLDLHACP